MKILKQSYRGSKLEEKLEPIGVVLATGKGYQHRDNPKDEFEWVTAKLIEKAEKLGATHIFGIEYRIAGDYFSNMYCYGDAYTNQK